MKPEHRKPILRFGEFIEHTYDACGQRHAPGIIWFAANARLIKFCQPQHVDFPRKMLIFHEANILFEVPVRKSGRSALTPPESYPPGPLNRAEPQTPYFQARS